MRPAALRVDSATQRRPPASVGEPHVDERPDPAAGPPPEALTRRLTREDVGLDSAEEGFRPDAFGDAGRGGSPAGPTTVPGSSTAAPAVGEITIERANEALARIDADTPTLVRDGISIVAARPPSPLEAVAHVLGGKTYVPPPDAAVLLDAGGRQQVLVVEDGGARRTFLVEHGEVIEALEPQESRELGGDDGARVSVLEETVTVSHSVTLPHPDGPRRSVATLSRDLDTASIYLRPERYPLLHYTVPGFEAVRPRYSVTTGQRVLEPQFGGLDGRGVQEQFDSYSGTPEGRAILGREGDLYGSDPDLQALFVARVRYLRHDDSPDFDLFGNDWDPADNGAPEYFGAFLPRRAALSGEALNVYDVQVRHVEAHLRGEAYFTRDGRSRGKLDESMLHLVASTLVDSYGNEPSRLEAVLDDVDRWIVSIDNADASGDSAGWYRRDPNGSTIQMSLPGLLPDLVRPNDSFDILTHEAAHSLDASDGLADGIPVGMSAADASVLRSERARLYALAYPGTPVSDLGGNRDYGSVADTSGLRDYVFANEREFWADTAAQFLTSDTVAMQVRSASPELYDVLRRYFGREDLPPGVISSSPVT